MSAYKIFISSPGDVGRERHLAEQVIRRVAAEFQDRVEVQPYFWEYEPMESTRDYQENIPLTSDFDLVISILWKRLGSPLSVKHERHGGGRWRSGTEFELVTAVESKKARGAPDIFIFKNDTKPTFEADEEGEGAKTELDLAQWKALIAFIKEWCEGVQDGQRVFTAALNRYQTLDQFEQVLEKLLVGKLNERFPPASGRSGSEPLRPPAPTWTEGSPFRGLEAFQFLHAPVFCGRTHAIGEVLDRLRRKAARGRPFVLILGASGSGKSSLAMAGVLPLLVKPGTIEGVGLWRRVVFRPGGQTEVGDLFDRLAAALVRRQQEGEGLPELITGSTTVQRLAADLRADPKAAALLVRSALNQVAVLYREAEAQKLRSWIAESQTENRAADVERYGRLLAELTPREARLALVIDQAEELFTADDLDRRPELRKGFAVALDALAASGVVFVLATLRSDFYSQIQQLPAFVDLKEADGQFDLLPAQPAEIAQMIRQPALAAGLRFEKDPQTQEGLDEVLAYQVEAEPRLLPLLEFALDELYKQRSADGLLTFEAYRVHLDGSIVRALAKRADATLEGLPERSRDAFRSVMRRLATTVDDTASGSAKGSQMDAIEKGSSGPTFQRQRVPYDQLTAYPPGAKAFVDAFVAARLLVVETGKTDDQKAEVTVAHEALFVHWTALKNLLLAERDDLILPRARVAASYERWRAENRAGDFLLPPGKQLSEAEQLLAEYGEELTPELKAYVAASITQAHAQQKRRQRLLVGALLLFALLAVGASAAAIFGFWQKGEAEKQTKKTGQVASQSEYLRGCQLTASGDEDRALLSFVNALELNSGNREAAIRLINLLGQRSWPRLIATLQHAHRVEQLVATPDGQRLFVAIGKGAADEISAVHAWDLKSLRLKATPQVGVNAAAPFLKLAVNVTGNRIMAFRNHRTYDSSLELFNANSGRMIRRCGDEPANCFFSSDSGFVLYSLKGQGIVKAVSATTGESIRTMQLDGPDFTKVVMADLIGGTIYILDNHGRLILQSSRADSPPQKHDLGPTLRGKVGNVAWACVSPDRHSLFALFESDNAFWYVGRWRLTDGKNEQVWGQTSNHEDVNGWEASFDAAGELTLLGQERNSLVVLKTSPDQFLVQQNLPMQRASIVSQNSFLAADGKTARIIPSDGGTVSGAMRHDGIITAVCPIGNGRFATGTADGEVKLWTLVPPAFSLQQASSPQLQKSGGAAKGERNEDEDTIMDVTRDHSAELRIRSSATGERRLILTRTENGKPLEVHGPWEDGFIFWTDACFAPDGKSFVVVGHVHVSSPGDSDYRARIFSTADGKLLGPALYHMGCDHAMFSSDGRRLITVGDNQIRVWDSLTTSPEYKVRGQPGVEWVQTDRNGRILVTLSEDGSGTVWDAENLQQVRDIVPDASWSSGRNGSPRTISIRPVLSADGRRLAAAAGNQVVIWDVDSGRPLTDPIVCGDQVQVLTFPDGSLNELHAKLDGGTEVVWKSTDLSAAFAQQDIQTLTVLAKYAGGSLPPGKIQLPDQQKDPSLGVLVNHFKKFSQEQNQLDALGENPKNVSSEAVDKFWLEAGRESCPPDAASDLIEALQQTARSSAENNQAVDRLRETWKRRGRHKIELDLAGSAVKLPGKYEDLGPSEKDAVGYLRTALAFEEQNPILLSGLAYLSRLGLKQESGGESQTPEEIENQQKANSDWVRQAEESAAKSNQKSLSEPEQAWKGAQVLACLGKIEEAVKLAQAACNAAEARGDYWVTMSVLSFALGNADAGSAALDSAGVIAGPDGDNAKSFKARFLIARGRGDDGAQVSLSISDQLFDPPLTIWTCDWLVSKGRVKEALDRMLKIDRSELEEGDLSVEARIAACFWKLGNKIAASPYFQDVFEGTAPDGSEAPLTDMPQDVLQAWQQGKIELQKQQIQDEKAQKPTLDPVKHPDVTNEPESPQTPATPASVAKTQDDIKEFLKKFIKAGESAAPDARVNFYALSVARYYEHGRIDRNQIPDLDKGYMAKWPTRSFEPILESFSAVEKSPGVYFVRLPFSYRLSNGTRTVKGTSILASTIVVDSNGLLSITEITEPKH